MATNARISRRLAPNRVSFTRILTGVSPSCTQGRSRVREFRLHGFGRGAVSNDRPYRASLRVFRNLTQTGVRQEKLAKNRR